VIGPIFFEDTVNSDRYVRDILEPFFQELTEEETRYGYYHQDGATAHTACNSMQRLRDVFDDEQNYQPRLMAASLSSSLYL
jgi:hypothetical protein